MDLRGSPQPAPKGAAHPGAGAPTRGSPSTVDTETGDVSSKSQGNNRSSNSFNSIDIRTSRGSSKTSSNIPISAPSTMRQPRYHQQQYLRRRHLQQHLCYSLAVLLPWLTALLVVMMTMSCGVTATSRTVNLEEELFKFLGMKRPVQNAPKRVPTFMQQLYKDQQMVNFGSSDSDHGRHNFNIKHNQLPEPPDTVRSIANITEISTVAEERPGVGRIRIKFAINGVSKSERLHGAQLRVTHSPRSSSYDSDEDNDYYDPNSVIGDFEHYSPQKYKKDQLPYVNYIRVYDVVRILDDGDTVLRLLDTTLVDRRESGVLTLDVGPAVERWVKKPHTNNGLVLEMDPYRKSRNSRPPDISHLRVKRDANMDDEIWQERRPFMVVYTDDGKPKPRVKRAKGQSPYDKLCQRHPLYVDFESVDWQNWILAPKGYNAYFCDGECEFPLGEHLNATNHAVVQTLVYSSYPNRVPRACCIPTELSPITMLYYDEYHHIVFKSYQNMVVEGCGCR